MSQVSLDVERCKYMRMESAPLSLCLSIIIKYEGTPDNIFILNTQLFANYITWDESHWLNTYSNSPLCIYSG